MLFVRSKPFRKKNKQAWNCPDNLIYNTTDVHSYQPTLWRISVLALIFLPKKFLLRKLCDLRDTMPRHCSLCLLLPPCYLQDAMPCHWSSSDLPQVLRIWESGFDSKAFFYLALPVGFKLSLGAISSTSKLAGLHAGLWYIAPARLFVWITTIHKRGMVVSSI